ncbi:MAG TPA: hypothetical protein VF484_07025 [Candidatus Limnocylindrales bacterium]
MIGGSRRPGRLVLASVLASALAGCIGSASPAPTLEPITAGPTPTVTRYEIGTTAWIEGFVVTVSSATASLDAKGGTLTVQAQITNAGPDDATLDVPLVVTAGDATFQLSHGTALPDEAAGSVSLVSLPFDVIGRATIDDGVIRIGRDGDHKVAIPLTPNPAALVTLQPVMATPTGSTRTTNFRVAIRGLEQRWDLPDWNDELPATSQALTVTYDVTYTGTFAGGIAFTADNVQLRLPDGSTVSPRQDGHSQSIELIAAGKTVKGMTSRFEIPDGLTGKLALLIVDGSSTRAISFTLGG